MNTDRAKGYIFITVLYAASAVAGLVIYRYLDNVDELIAIAAADLAATIMIWAAGVAVRNSSVYDPYWSVAPIVILTLYAGEKGITGSAGLLMLSAVWIWGVRLTANWAYTFKGLKYQDWRYDKYKADLPRIWPLVNFFGINFMPTVIVYLAMLPALIVIRDGYQGRVITYFAFAICLSAVVIQFQADTRLHRFRNSSADCEVCSEGLWNYSRHPNYFGEIMMWWGVLLMLLTVKPDKWIMGAGAFLNTLLFVFISIPLMEKRQLANKPDYISYMRKTRMLIPFPKR